MFILFIYFLLFILFLQSIFLILFLILFLIWTFSGSFVAIMEDYSDFNETTYSPVSITLKKLINTNVCILYIVDLPFLVLPAYTWSA